ncbi:MULTISPECIES: TAXI family TRAP transporter solute-binding subunit [Rhizobium]|uniref:TAXI family TRAP transporter solute-binding subunit n=1 Tax=Rhizobium paranaense TaxID=1650438 RepID=A0A7W9D4H3_9HYPH|nr:TAXI family TRAP transporter solute-binding subunit [Rhizobium paranaense]MBB5577368.1 hypothetical protein [Rhizobium paranaense]
MTTESGAATEIKILAAGANFSKYGSMIGQGLTGYFGDLPEGTTVSVHNMHPGEACIIGPELVDSGRYHMALTSPSWLVETARAGRGANGFGERPLRLMAIGVFPHFDQFAFAVRKDLGISSIRQIKEQKIPLRISTAPTHLHHPTGWVLDIVLAEYGMSIEEMESWGGSVVFGDRQPNLMEKVPEGRLDRVSGMRSGALNAVFDEALMTRPWKDIADTVDLTFLPIDEDVLDRIERKHGIRRAIMPKNSLRGVDADVPTVDFSGHILFCREDLPDEIAYATIRGIDQQKRQIESIFLPEQGLTGPVDLSQMWKDTYVPLHPGAEKYYRDCGYM